MARRWLQAALGQACAYRACAPLAACGSKRAQGACAPQLAAKAASRQGGSPLGGSRPRLQAASLLLRACGPRPKLAAHRACALQLAAKGLWAKDPSVPHTALALPRLAAGRIGSPQPHLPPSPLSTKFALASSLG